MKRGAVTKRQSKLVNVWIPEMEIPFIDEAARLEDTDRSKFIRKAIRERMANFPIRKAAAK